MNDLTYISPHEIKPLHPVKMPRKVNDLARDMKARGWRGRELLIIERKAGFDAWTGSHRIAAARKAGLEEVPCYVVNEAEFEARGLDADLHCQDYERLDIVRKLGDETAIRLMWAECTVLS